MLDCSLRVRDEPTGSECVNDVVAKVELHVVEAGYMRSKDELRGTEAHAAEGSPHADEAYKSTSWCL